MFCERNHRLLHVIKVLGGVVYDRSVALSTAAVKYEVWLKRNGTIEFRSLFRCISYNVHIV